MLTGENGILSQAQRAKNETEKAQSDEENTLASYESYLNSYSGENTEFTDSLENKVIVPAGFRVVNPEDNVEDGIIIEDMTHGTTAGSQFVWIPVGTIQTSEGPETITLGRYSFSSTGEASEYSGSYTEDTVAEHTYDNIPAKDITTFISKVTNETHGYYIGRYEARTLAPRTASTDDSGLTQITVKSDDYVYNYVTQKQAAEISQGMYAENSNFTSDLMNSYAWDTAIDFLQKCDDRDGTDNKPYSRQTTVNSTLASQGTNNQTTKDVICNVYDMASNCWEWTTETYSNASPCSYRGGSYNLSNYYTASRYGNPTSHSTSHSSFRPILYL